MSRAVKPTAIEYELSSAEAYSLSRLSIRLHEAETETGRARKALRDLAAHSLDRQGANDSTDAGWGFDVRDSGVFLVKRGES